MVTSQLVSRGAPSHSWCPLALDPLRRGLDSHQLRPLLWVPSVATDDERGSNVRSMITAPWPVHVPSLVRSPSGVGFHAGATVWNQQVTSPNSTLAGTLPRFRAPRELRPLGAPRRRIIGNPDLKRSTFLGPSSVVTRPESGNRTRLTWPLDSHLLLAAEQILS